MTTESLRKFSVQIGPWRRDPSIHPSRYDLWTWQGLQRDRRKTSKQLGLGVCTEITIKRLAEKNVRCLTQTDNRCRDFCRNIFFNKLSSDVQRRLTPPFFILIPYDVLWCPSILLSIYCCIGKYPFDLFVYAHSDEWYPLFYQSINWMSMSSRQKEQQLPRHPLKCICCIYVAVAAAVDVARL